MLNKERYTYISIFISFIILLSLINVNNTKIINFITSPISATILIMLLIISSYFNFDISFVFLIVFLLIRQYYLKQKNELFQNPTVSSNCKNTFAEDDLPTLGSAGFDQENCMLNYFRLNDSGTIDEARSLCCDQGFQTCMTQTSENLIGTCFDPATNKYDYCLSQKSNSISNSCCKPPRDVEPLNTKCSCNPKLELPINKCTVLPDDSIKKSCIDNCNNIYNNSSNSNSNKEEQDKMCIHSCCVVDLNKCVTNAKNEEDINTCYKTHHPNHDGGDIEENINLYCDCPEKIVKPVCKDTSNPEVLKCVKYGLYSSMGQDIDKIINYCNIDCLRNKINNSIVSDNAKYHDGFDKISSDNECLDKVNKIS